jgi:hypothetical protein
MVAWSLTRPLVTLGIAVALAACSGTATPLPPGGGGAPPSAAVSAAGATASSAAGSTGSSGAGGASGFEGSFKTSGLYSATWTVAPGMEPNPFNSVNNPSLTSDKNTFGNIKVDLAGSVSFGSAATGLSQNGAYKGTGAKVTLDPSGQFVCAFTVDTDLTGSNDKAILHIAGGLTVHWHSVGDLNCP